MSERRLKDWLHSYLHYTSFSEAPDVFHFWTGVSTIAGALRRKVYIDQEYFRWTPNFYIIFVAPSGVATKSTTMSIGMSLLRENPAIKFGPNVITWQALITALANAREEVELGEPGNFEAMSCLTFAASELGTLLDPHDRAMTDVLTDLWDGRQEAWRKVTKMSGDDTIANPWLNIIAGTTPSWISENMPRSVIGGGFTSRCVFVYAERKRRLVAYPKFEIQRQTKSDFAAERAALLHDLEMIAALKGEYHLAPEAIELGEEWYSRINDPQGRDAHLSQFDGYLSRKQGHVHKLAMVLAASRRDELFIGRQDLQDAITITEALETDMPKVFSLIDVTPSQMVAERLIRFVETRGPAGVPRSTVARMFFRTLGAREMDEALNSAIRAGYIRIEERTNGQHLVSARSFGEP